MPSLARSVPKPLKVPSLARSVPKPLKMPSLARSVLKPLKEPSLARSVPKPLSIFVRRTEGQELLGQPSQHVDPLLSGREVNIKGGIRSFFKKNFQLN